MKMRKNAQTAFAIPESLWSRNRSKRTVITIQIQANSRDHSKTSSRNSPKSMSASGIVMLGLLRPVDRQLVDQHHVEGDDQQGPERGGAEPNDLQDRVQGEQEQAQDTGD